MERTLFLHHYLPAFIFKILLLAATIEHVHNVLRSKVGKKFSLMFVFAVCSWLVFTVQTFIIFSVLSYGMSDLNENDLIHLRWKDTWDFILHRK